VLKTSHRYLLLTIIALTTMILDQIVKLYIQKSMRLHETIIVIPGFFHLTYIRNPGAAFGLLANQGNGFRFVFFGVTSLAAVVLLGALLYKTPPDQRMTPLAISLVLGGALGNLLDRIRFGEVVDFMDFFVNGFHWPAFNLADSAITIGITILLINFFLERKKNPSAS
jgi:signal peptidase II